MLIFLGVEEGDTEEDAGWLAGKIARLRIFEDATGNMNLSADANGGEFLLISQFTLFASTRKGNRPSFTRSARPEIAERLYEDFATKLSAAAGKEVKTGTFGASMEIALVNMGPVTILIDSKIRE